MKKIFASVISISILTACQNDSDNKNSTAIPYTGAVIATVASDFGSSDVVSVDEAYNATESIYPQSFSDMSLNVGNNALYVINKFGQNNIVKLTSSNLNNVEWQYSTNNSDNANQQSNPYQIIEVSDTKAYVLRYGTGEIWVVNPNAESDEDFKLSEIDISSFDGDGIPEMTSGVIHNGRLYVSLQRLTSFHADQDSFLIAINTDSDEIVDLSPTDDQTEAFTLSVRNPTSISLDEDTLYVQGVGRYEETNFTTFEVIQETQYVGGIEAINLNNMTSSIVVDDGDQDTHPYGQINSVSTYNDIIAFTGYAGWQNVSVYIKFGTEAPVTMDDDLTGKDIRFAKFDSEGKLWVGVATASDPQVLVYEKNNQNEFILANTILTTLLPSQIQFK